jgi:hypothetical protein
VLSIGLQHHLNLNVGLLKHQPIMMMRIHIDVIMMKKRRSGYMSNEGKKDQDQEAKEAPDKKPAPQNISIQEILGSYPIDRDKCRDVLLVEMSTSLRRIADSLEAIPQALLLISKELQSKPKE